MPPWAGDVFELVSDSAIEIPEPEIPEFIGQSESELCQFHDDTPCPSPECNDCESPAAYGNRLKLHCTWDAEKICKPGYLRDKCYTRFC